MISHSGYLICLFSSPNIVKHPFWTIFSKKIIGLMPFGLGQIIQIMSMCPLKQQDAEFPLSWPFIQWTTFMKSCLYTKQEVNVYKCVQTQDWLKGLNGKGEKTKKLSEQKFYGGVFTIGIQNELIKFILNTYQKLKNPHQQSNPTEIYFQPCYAYYERQIFS